MDNDFTLDDFRMHIQNIQKMGMKNMIRRMPGLAEVMRDGEDPDVAIMRVQRMISAMAPEERANPDIIDEDRRVRIAASADVQPHEVAEFLKQFETVRALMKQMMNMGLWERIQLVLGLRVFPRLPPPGQT